MLTPAASDSLTISPVIQNGSSTLALVKQGSGLVALSGVNTFSGNTTISSGTLQLSGGGSWAAAIIRAAIANSGSLVIGTSSNQTFGGVISGSGLLNQTGSGTTTLLGNNNYTGGTNISAGALSIASTSALPGRAFRQLLGGPCRGAGGGRRGHRCQYRGHPCHRQLCRRGKPGPWHLGRARTYAGNIADANISSGSLGLFKVARNALTLTGTNTYTGGTMINGGVLSVASTAALPNSGTSGYVSVANNATLAIAAGGAGQWGATDLGNLMAANSGNFAGGSTLAIDTTGGSLTYSGAIAGGMGLAKLGGNTLYLNGANSYSGSTSVGGGVLEVATTAALPNYATAGKLAVASSATLAVAVGGTGQWNSGSSDNIGSLLTASGTNFAAGSMLGIDTTGGNFTYGSAIGGRWA